MERRTTAAPAARGGRATASREDEDGWLYFEGRNDDVIVSAGYRIGPFEVESALVAHPAVAEAAAVAAPDEERGSVVRAVVVLRDGDTRPRPSSRASCRSTSSARPRLTSTRASSSSPTSCRRPPAARSGAPRCARSDSRPPPRGMGDGRLAQTSCSATCAVALARPKSLSSCSTSCCTVDTGGRSTRNAARMPNATNTAATR